MYISCSNILKTMLKTNSCQIMQKINKIEVSMCFENNYIRARGFLEIE